MGLVSELWVCVSIPSQMTVMDSAVLDHDKIEGTTEGLQSLKSDFIRVKKNVLEHDASVNTEN